VLSYPSDVYGMYGRCEKDWQFGFKAFIYSVTFFLIDLAFIGWIQFPGTTAYIMTVITGTFISTFGSLIVVAIQTALNLLPFGALLLLLLQVSSSFYG
jgi:hypothetical protein